MRGSERKKKRHHTAIRGKREVFFPVQHSNTKDPQHDAGVGELEASCAGSSAYLFIIDTIITHFITPLKRSFIAGRAFYLDFKQFRKHFFLFSPWRQC